MSENNNYVCPYCGTLVGKEDVLFWEEVKTQYTDNIRGDFLRRHGLSVFLSQHKDARSLQRQRRRHVYQPGPAR